MIMSNGYFKAICILIKQKIEDLVLVRLTHKLDCGKAGHSQWGKQEVTSHNVEEVSSEIRGT